MRKREPGDTGLFMCGYKPLYAARQKIIVFCDLLFPAGWANLFIMG